MQFPNRTLLQTTRTWLHYIVVSVALVTFSTLLRIWPLQDLGVRLAFLTFYPAVMIASLYGGFFIGLLTTILSALTIIYWSPTGQPFLNDSSDWLGMAVFLANSVMISLVAEAMRRAQSRAKKAQEQAEFANQAKSVFLSTMSHELRTPLNSILGFSDLMRRDPGITKRMYQNLEIINRSGEHLLHLINDVLDMAKIESGRVALETNLFDLGSMVGEIMEMMNIPAQEKGLQLLLDQSPQFPRFVKGDEEKLRQMIVNMMSNAIKYTNQGNVTLRLDIQFVEGATIRLNIKVEDTGIGIKKTDQASIFEPFVQVGKPATQKGTGLGLAIVREYVKLMGGSIGVESTPDKGSLFWISLPVQKAEETEVVEAMQANNLKTQAIGLEPGQPQYRILIVEDQEENWLLLQRLLEDIGFTVQVAENGAIGVEIFQRFRPHFIWMDRRMPVMDGFEATRRIRALDGGKDVKIVAITASAFTEQRGEALVAGMDDFVRKPYRPAEIFDCIAKHLGVRYVYEQSPLTEVDLTLSHEDLIKLPESLRIDLANGLVLGNVDHLAKLIIDVESHNTKLAKTIANYLVNFNYQPVLKALETAETTIKKEPSL